MSLNRNEKEAVIEQVSAQAAKSQTLALAEYRGLKVADLDTLRELALQTVGQEGADLIRDPQPREIVAEWEGNLAEAERRGIFGTPTYVVGDELFWGQDRLDFVERALSEARAHKESA